MPPHPRMTDHAAPESPVTTTKNTEADETEVPVQEVTKPPPVVLSVGETRIGGDSAQVAKESSTRAASTANGANSSDDAANLSLLLESFDLDQAGSESSACLKLKVSTLPPSGPPVPSDTSLSLKRTVSRGESSSLHHHNASMRMEDVGVLMREQDADLLESIQRKGPNQTGMTPVLLSSRSEFDKLSVQQIPSFSLDESNTPKTGATISSNDMMMTMNLIHPSTSAPCFDSTRDASVAQTQQLGPVLVPSQQRSYAGHSHSNRSLLCRSPLGRETSNDERSTSAPSEARERNSVTQPQLLQPPPHLSPLQLKNRQVSFTRQFSGGYDDSIPSYLPESLEHTRRALSGDIYLQEQDQQEGSVLSDRDSVDESILDNDNEKVLRRSESAERRINEAAQFAEAVGDLPLTEQEDLRIIDEVNDEGVEVDDDDDDDDATVVRVERSRMLRQPSKSKAVVAKRAISTDVGDASMDSVFAPDRVQLENRSGHAARSSSSLPSASVICPETPVKARPSWPIAQYETRHTDPGVPAPQISPSRRAAFLAQLPSSASTQDFVYKGIRANPPEIIKRGTTRGNYAQLHRKAWLEVSDKYHRYGKHLRLYYRYWERLGFPTNMFFDWLDSKGEAAGQSLPELEECPRSQLDSDTVLYISNPDVTANYALQLIAEQAPVVDDHGNKEVMRRCRVLDVDGDPVKTGPDGWIFVLRDNVFYGSLKITSVIGHSKQRFHHSSFFGGKAVAAAGIFLTDDDGFLTRLYPHSGHYRPGEAHVQRILFFIFHEGIDLRTFEMDVQQIQHVSRDGDPPTKVKSPTKVCSKVDDPDKENGDDSAKPEKKKKMESLQLVPAVIVACFLAHKARFIGEGIFAQIHQIRKMEVTSVVEALDVIDNGGYWKQKRQGAL